MHILEQLKNNKGTVSSKVGKELAQEVLKGDSEILEKAVMLTTYAQTIKERKTYGLGLLKL